MSKRKSKYLFTNEQFFDCLSKKKQQKILHLFILEKIYSINQIIINQCKDILSICEYYDKRKKKDKFLMSSDWDK